MDLLVDPIIQYGFFRIGLVTAIIVGVTCSVLSCLLVVRHQALLGDAVSHAVLPGVAVGYLVAGHAGVFPGALIAGLLSTVVMTWLDESTPIKLDAIMGIVFSAAFALGLAIISITRPRGIDLFHVLFGNVLGVSPADLATTAITATLVLVATIGLFPYFHMWSFDPNGANAAGLPTTMLNYLFAALLAATIVAALQAVGIVLVVAMLITPGATALLVSRRLSRMMAVAAGAGTLAAVLGLYMSYYLDIASGPAIVLTATGLFALILLVSPRGLRRHRVPVVSSRPRTNR